MPRSFRRCRCFSAPTRSCCRLWLKGRRRPPATSIPTHAVGRELVDRRMSGPSTVSRSRVPASPTGREPAARRATPLRRRSPYRRCLLDDGRIRSDRWVSLAGDACRAVHRRRSGKASGFDRRSSAEATLSPLPGCKRENAEARLSRLLRPGRTGRFTARDPSWRGCGGCAVGGGGLRDCGCQPSQPRLVPFLRAGGARRNRDDARRKPRMRGRAARGWLLATRVLSASARAHGGAPVGRLGRGAAGAHRRHPHPMWSRSSTTRTASPRPGMRAAALELPPGTNRSRPTPPLGLPDASDVGRHR